MRKLWHCRWTEYHQALHCCKRPASPVVYVFHLSPRNYLNGRTLNINKSAMCGSPKYTGLDPGLCLNMKYVFPCMRISSIKIGRSLYPLIFIVGICILLRRHFYIETAPGHHCTCIYPDNRWYLVTSKYRFISRFFDSHYFRKKSRLPLFIKITWNLAAFSAS